MTIAAPATADTFWRDHAACREDPDLWYSTDRHDRNRAAHICLAHCPVFARCLKEVNKQPCPHAIQAAVRYDDHVRPRPVLQQPDPDAAACRECGTGTTTRRRRKPPTIRPSCGKPSGPEAHRYRGERNCDLCRGAERERSRRRRDKVRDAACGTPAGVQRHQRLNIPLCEPCARVKAESDAFHVARCNGSQTVDEYERMVATVRRLAEHHYSDAEIAAVIGLTRRRVRHLRHVNGIPAGVGRGSDYARPRRDRKGLAA